MKTQAVLRAPLVASAILLATMTVPTHAQESDSRRYVGVQYANLDLDSSGNDVDVDLDWTTPALMVNVGYQINPYFAVEGRAGIGVSDDDDDFFFGEDENGNPIPRSTDAEIESYFGVFGRVGMPAGEVFYPYIQVGYGSVKIDSNRIGGDVDESDFAYGIGANFNFTETMSGNLEYMSYYDEDDTELSGFSLGLQFDF